MVSARTLLKSKLTRGIAHKIWVEIIHKTKRSIINGQAKYVHIVRIENSIKVYKRQNSKYEILYFYFLRYLY